MRRSTGWKKCPIELTARMLAVLFDFPYADRHKLVYWSDMTTASPQLMGDAGVTGRRTQSRTAGLREYVCAAVDRARQRANRGNDLISMLAHGESTRDMMSRPHGIPRQHPAADRRRQRHDAQHDQRRRAGAERIARSVPEVAREPHADPEHGRRDGALADVGDSHAPHRAARHRTRRQEDPRRGQGDHVVPVGQSRRSGVRESATS